LTNQTFIRLWLILSDKLGAANSSPKVYIVDIVDYLGLALWPTFWIVFYNHDYVINYCLDLGQFAGETTGIAGISPPAMFS